MKGVDTNVLVRYLVADDPDQAAKAKRYMQAGTIHLSCVVLAETVWVLESAYGYDKEAIVAALDQLLSAHEVAAEDAELALAALRDYRDSNAGFTDCLIGRRNAANGCEETGSFDKRAKGAFGFKIL